jgi:RND family efflux transporter MFP subunit
MGPAALVAALAITGCSNAVPEARADNRPPAVRVESATVVAAAVPEQLTLTGTLIANRESSVAADASGRVVLAGVERGDFVKRGALLARLDSRAASLAATEAAAQARSAHAQKQLATSDCARADALLREGVISKAEHDRTTTHCSGAAFSATAADARAAIAGKAVGDSTIVAPFAGLIAERHIETGEYVRPDSRIVTLVDIDKLRLEITVPESSVSRVRAGQQVSFEVQSFEGEQFAAEIRYVGPSMRRASRDLLVEAMVDNAARRLRPGMFVTASIRVGESSLPVVPKKSLRKQGNTQRIFVIVGDRVEERLVETRPEHDGLVPIGSGVQPGDRVVAEVTDHIHDGLLVE